MHRLSLCVIILTLLQYRSTTLHAGRVQEQRELAMDGFRQGRFDVLVATDLAGRGIDVKGVTHIINYDMPKSIEGTCTSLLFCLF